jgi:chromosome segregation ATPase
MANFGRFAFTRRLAIVATAFILLAIPGTALSRPALAATADVISPVEDFSRELEKLKQNFADLGRKIDESAKAIDSYTDAEKTRKEIEDLRTAVAAMLDAVADNGALSKLGDLALARARTKLRDLEHDNRFKPEERQYLVEQWRKLREDTEAASQELGAARGHFAELLRTLQANEDFIDELVEIRQAKKVIDVIHELTRDIRGASDELQRLIGGIKPPGA